MAMAGPRVSFKITILALFVLLTVALSAVVLSLSYRRSSETAPVIHCRASALRRT